MKSVRLQVEALGAVEDRPGVGAVEDGEVEEAVCRPEDLPEDLGREAGAAHPHQEGEVEAVGPDGVDELLDPASCRRIASGLSSQPRRSAIPFGSGFQRV